jgi:hypothetical protein
METPMKMERPMDVRNGINPVHVSGRITPVIKSEPIGEGGLIQQVKE